MSDILYEENKNNLCIYEGCKSMAFYDLIDNCHTRCKEHKLDDKVYETTICWIDKAKKVWNNTFSYKFVVIEKKSQSNKIYILCKECNVLCSQIPRSFLKKMNPCKKCNLNQRSKNNTKTYEYFIQKSKEIHGESYIYPSKEKYKNMKTSVLIFCITCNKFFSQTPSKHIHSKQGCKTCGIKKSSEKQKLTKQEIIERANKTHNSYNLKYRYDKINNIISERIGGQEYIEIFCYECNKYFIQKVENHLSGCGCQQCGIRSSSNNRRKTTEELIIDIKQIFPENKDDLSKIIYKNHDIKIIIGCCKCYRDYDITPNNYLRGKRCPYCKNKTEAILYDFLNKNHNTIIQYKQDWCKNKRYLPFDFCIEELKIIIELDGRQHFGQIEKWTSLEQVNENDRYKMKCANENGFSVIRIVQEDVWNDKYDWKKELLENIEKIKHEGKVKNIFMCKNGEYNIFC